MSPRRFRSNRFPTIDAYHSLALPDLYPSDNFTRGHFTHTYKTIAPPEYTCLLLYLIRFSFAEVIDIEALQSPEHEAALWHTCQDYTMNLMPTLVDGPDFALMEIVTTNVQETNLDANTFSDFDHAYPIGISPGYSPAGELIALAIADYNQCLIVELSISSKRNGGRRDERSTTRNLEDLESRILCRPAGELYAFDMGPLALSLYLNSKLRVMNAVDIQSTESAQGEERKPLPDRRPLTAIENILGDSVSVSINKRNVADVFEHTIYKPGDRKSTSNLAQRAWISQLLATHGNGAETMSVIPRIDTQKFPEQILDMITKIAIDTLRQDVNKPLITTHQAKINSDGSGTKVMSEVYKNKIRANQNLRMIAHGPAGEYVIPAISGKVAGRSGALSAERSLCNAEISSVISIGRAEPTTAEVKRAATVLRVLQGQERLLDDSPWIQNIWFATATPLSWPITWSDAPDEPDSPIISEPPKVLLRLNPSQQDAVNTMYSTLDEHRITIVQGPPGTGKTSVIASFVVYAVQTGYKGIWLVAQSNVAVKNIAEKLIDVGFHDWKLLVSKDFMFQWHEHIYMKVKKNIIRSDEFFALNPLYALKGCQVILATLSMLSNIFIKKFTSQIPITTLVVDEASQIEIGSYLPILSTCHTLRKICFIGDDQQLPPYGQEELKDLQSIFEVSHLRHHALFLDVQYRMPPQIGDIISELVYDGKLKSNPLHAITNKIVACHFVDVPSTEERSGDSFKNTAECKVVVQLAHQLQQLKKNYQIISPYDGQRNNIEAELVLQGLDWENKCFNVDSFQGNEEDYIIISLVRSRDIGFLANRRRTNVMLTRCKKGMFIVSSQKFLKDKFGGASTLVGEILEQIGEGAWLDLKDIQEGRF